jgi:hypothetical protein
VRPCRTHCTSSTACISTQPIGFACICDDRSVAAGLYCWWRGGDERVIEKLDHVRQPRRTDDRCVQCSRIGVSSGSKIRLAWWILLGYSYSSTCLIWVMTGTIDECVAGSTLGAPISARVCSKSPQKLTASDTQANNNTAKSGCIPGS